MTSMRTHAILPPTPEAPATQPDTSCLLLVQPTKEAAIGCDAGGPAVLSSGFEWPLKRRRTSRERDALLIPRQLPSSAAPLRLLSHPVERGASLFDFLCQ